MPRARLEGLVERIRSSAGLDGSFGAEIAPRSDRYLIDRVSGQRMHPLNGVVVDAGAGIGGKAMLLGRPMAVTDYQRADCITHDFDQPVAQSGLRSILAIPVMLDGVPRAMIYGALRSANPISDRRIDIAYRLINEYRFDLRVDDEVARRFDELDTAAGARESAHLREQLRAVHAEARALADEVTDPQLRARIEALSVRAGGGGQPSEPPQTDYQLTRRELDVVVQVAAGLSNADVACRLGLAPATIKAYLKTAMRKTGVHNRLALIAACRRAGLIT
ncbi:helix-turn-helix transcriptional regulator [Haloechinothrix sp. YIM 98757]|uniref:Helix-turn-helix transcriptional regulator n=1 Tax=Haloechinothrix aidingensis TaxID=2752311 RepID=A0A838A4E0_9PSEU|nr:LuxR C-terminal-related transcriptional regulator [Haloechinothrix aidingensis]MBA0124470.1 helix-turn-helix transcriptional regulator [Haloechinothrix aidingensis]